jgi:hypothetical protein
MINNTPLLDWHEGQPGTILMVGVSVTTSIYS